MCSEPYLFTFVGPVISPGFRLPYGGALTSGALNQPDREQCRAAAPPGEQANAPMSTEVSRVRRKRRSRRSFSGSKEKGGRSRPSRSAEGALPPAPAPAQGRSGARSGKCDGGGAPVANLLIT